MQQMALMEGRLSGILPTGQVSIEAVTHTVVFNPTRDGLNEHLPRRQDPGELAIDLGDLLDHDENPKVGLRGEHLPEQHLGQPAEHDRRDAKEAHEVRGKLLGQRGEELQEQQQ